MSDYTTRTTCRICNSTALVPLFSLGSQFVSNFVDKEHIHDGLKCPIDLVLCGNCSLVQLRHTAPQDLMYSRFYWFKTGLTKSLREAMRAITSEIEWQVELKEGDRVLDIGCNDSTMLRSYVSPCYKVGVEPASNLADEARVGIDLLLRDFWPDCAHALKPGFKAITAIGMMYDSDKPNEFVSAIAKLLAPDGIFIAQLMCLKNMLAMNDVGNLCHEHLLFPSLKSLQYLYNRHGLEIYDLETNDTNGQSYRIYARHKGSNAGITQLDNVRMHEAAEIGLDRPEFYGEFFSRMEKNKEDVVRFVKSEKNQGRSVWLLGASTKANTLLQFYGLDHTLIDGASERTPEKVGKYTIGTGIPIWDEETARRRADTMLAIPFAFRREIIEREKQWRSVEGRKIAFALPFLEIL